MRSHVVRWTSYQLRYLRDQSTQKAVVKSRRIGFSEVVAFESACRATGLVLLPDPPVTLVKGVHQIIVSAGMPQAIDLLARVVHHLQGLMLSGYPGMPTIVRQSATIVQLSNGVQLRAFSTNPASLRGFRGDVILDEFAAAPRQDAIWAAAYACASANLGDREGYRVRVVGTPLGDSNRFWRICKGDLAGAFRVHTVTIHDAVSAGFPLRTKDNRPGTIDDLREEIGDSDTFAQEFEASFLSSSARYISEELYDAAIYGITEQLPPNTKHVGAGMDVARTGHKSSIAQIAADVGGTMWCTSVTSERGMPWPAQETWAGKAVEKCGTLAVDVGGLGTQFGERLVAQHGSRIIPLQFDTKVKDMIFSGLRLSLERMNEHGKPRLRVPHDQNLRRAVLSLRRRYSNAGNTVYDLDESAAGHGDEAVALALAVHAAGGSVIDRRELSASPVYAPTRTEQQKYTRPKRGGMWG